MAGLKSREIHSDKNVINSLQPVITITQRKDIILYFYKHIFGWTRLTLAQLLKKTNMFLFSCVHVRNWDNLVPRAFPEHFLREKPWGRGCNWESTNFNLIPRAFSATFRLRAKARIFPSFQLLSIVLTYKLNWLFHFSQPVLDESSSGNDEKRKRPRDRKFFCLTRTLK